MVEAHSVRASGQTTAEEIASEVPKDVDQTFNIDDDKPVGLARAFRRMRTDWNSQDNEIIQVVRKAVNQQLTLDFGDAYGLMFEIYDTVREPEVDDNGVVLEDEIGLPIWKQRADGSYMEDWDRIGRKERERFLYILITRMFDWQQTAADAWGEALFAKARLEEAFATAFDSITEGKTTVDARNARANRLAADERYLAVYKSYYSRKADGILRSMEALSQRFKDIHTT